MRAIIEMDGCNTVNITADRLDCDNDFLYAYNGSTMVGIFSLKIVKEAHLSEKNERK